MRKFLLTILIAVAVLAGASFSTGSELEPAPVSAAEPTDTYETMFVSDVKQAAAPNYILEPVVSKEVVAESEPVMLEEVIVEPEVLSVTEEELELLALVAMAEAEGESEEGQRLVIDVVLNRVDDPHFPDTIYDVIYQPNQFCGMYGDRIARCYVKDELVQLAREEVANRTNYDVIFFRTQHYHSYGVPMFQVGAHYFSSYD